MRSVTYGVSGLIDWNAQIPIGKARLSVHFTGGALTKYGVTPAEFTTTDPTTQHLIENSEYYRTGRIRTLRSVGKPDVLPVSQKRGIEARNAFAEATLPFDTPSAAAPQVIEMACIEDAIEYMREHYKLPAVMLRNPDALKAAAVQHGIEFKF